MLQFEGVGFGSGGDAGFDVAYFTSNDWTLDITGTQLSTGLSFSGKVIVFKNGQGPLHPTDDYTISGSIITFVTPLISTDKIEIIYQ